MTRRTNRGMPTIAVDFLFLALLAFVMLINPPTKEADSAPPPGSISVAVAWPEGSTDVDLWVQGPNNGKPTGYSNRSGRVFSLLRDDLGTAGDLMPLNYENAYGRATPAGEYIINVHCFTCSGTVPVSVEVRIGKQVGIMSLVYQGVVELRAKQERTAIRFRLDSNGNVVPGSANHVFKALRSAT